MSEEQNDSQKLDPEVRRQRLREIQLPNERKIIKHPDFEIAWPEKVTWVGFVVVLGLCILIIFGASWIGKMLM